LPSLAMAVYQTPQFNKKDTSAPQKPTFLICFLFAAKGSR